jgi:hypothetical protein
MRGNVKKKASIHRHEGTGNKDEKKERILQGHGHRTPEYYNDVGGEHRERTGGSGQIDGEEER